MGLYSVIFAYNLPLLANHFCSFPFIFNHAAAVDCRTPPIAHVNGKEPMYSNTTFGSKVMYTCQPGYMHEGNRTITCLANGQWSSKNAPVCSRELPLAAGSTSPVL